jgi:hypothetical protein
MRHSALIAGSTCVLLLQAVAPGRAENAPASSAQEQTLKVSDVPPEIVSIARKELGTRPTDAKAVIFEGQTAYELQGTNRYYKHLTVVVSRDGKILKPVSIWEADDD